MTRGSIREYTEAVRERCRRSFKKRKTRILDEFIELTGYHPDRSGPSVCQECV